MSDTDIPTRPDGTPKAFWYDPEFGRHIMHRFDDGTIETICVGHNE